MIDYAHELMRQVLTRGQIIGTARVGSQCQPERRMRCDGQWRQVCGEKDRKRSSSGLSRCTVRCRGRQGADILGGMGGQDAALSGGFVPQKMLIQSEWRAFASRMTILARGSVFFPGTVFFLRR